MTQNRMTRQADKRAHLDLQVNLLAEQELTAILQMLNALCQRMGVAVPARDARVEQLVKETDIHQLASALDRELAEDAVTAPSSAPAPRTQSPASLHEAACVACVCAACSARSPTHTGRPQFLMLHPARPTHVRSAPSRAGRVRPAAHKPRDPWRNRRCARRAACCPPVSTIRATPCSSRHRPAGRGGGRRRSRAGPVGRQDLNPLDPPDARDPPASPNFPGRNPPDPLDPPDPDPPNSPDPLDPPDLSAPPDPLDLSDPPDHVVDAHSSVARLKRCCFSGRAQSGTGAAASFDPDLRARRIAGRRNADRDRRERRTGRMRIRPPPTVRSGS